MSSHEWVHWGSETGVHLPYDITIINWLRFGEERGRLQPCIDYQGLKQVTVSSGISPFGAQKDMGGQSFHKVGPAEIHEGTFTAFSTTLGNFKYCIMLYGLSSATAVFQCLINDFLRDILGKFVVTYMSPMSNMCWPNSSSITSISNEKKCELHTARINFPVYFTAGVIMDQENVSAVIN